MESIQLGAPALGAVVEEEIVGGNAGGERVVPVRHQPRHSITRSDERGRGLRDAWLEGAGPCERVEGIVDGFTPPRIAQVPKGNDADAVLGKHRICEPYPGRPPLWATT